LIYEGIGTIMERLQTKTTLELQESEAMRERKRAKIFGLAGIFIGMSLQANAMSVNADRVFEKNVESKYPVSFSISTGMLNGESEEYAYSDYFGSDGKVSKLTWDLKHVFMVGAETSIGLSRRVSLNFGGWINANNGSGDMSDYDWMNGDDRPWTDKSDHSTDLEEGMMLDANIDIVLLSKENYTLSGVVGFRHDKFRWNADDGMGVYSTSLYPGDRGQDVEFDGKAISYKQELYAPYLGFNFDYNKNKWTCNTYIRASLWAWGEATDTHYSPAGKYTLNKDLVLPDGRVVPKGSVAESEKGEKSSFKDEVDDMFYLSFGLGIDYQFTERLSGGLSADFQKYNKEEDDDRKTNEFGEESWGGMSHMSYMFTASAKYSF